MTDFDNIIIYIKRNVVNNSYMLHVYDWVKLDFYVLNIYTLGCTL